MMKAKLPQRITESKLSAFALAVFTRLGVAPPVAELAARSLVEASLMGIETHGVEALDMYVRHLRAGGLPPRCDPQMVAACGGLERWDLQHGIGLAAARVVMGHVVERAAHDGVCMAACRNANHIGACGVYGKMAADQGMIGIVTQQTMALLAPWGGSAGRIGASPFAVVAPVKDAFPFYFDASMAAITRGRIKACQRAGKSLPPGAAVDCDGRPTVDPEAAWQGLILPIGQHKGVGLAMAFELLSGLLSGNRFSTEIPSVVNNPEKSAGSGVFLMAINPRSLMDGEDFDAAMRRYVEMVESSPALDARHPPRYPGRRAGENWLDRTRNGIPVSAAGLQRFTKIAAELGLPPPA